MEDLKTWRIDAFTGAWGGGNPAGVVLVDDFPNDNQMQSIAKTLNYSETAFVRQEAPQKQAIRYFTPTREVPLCGHATIASYHLLQQESILSPGTFDLKTNAGPQKVEVMNDGRIFMSQNKPEFGEVVPKVEFAQCFKNIGENDLVHHGKLVSTGLWKIFLEVESAKALETLTPNISEIDKLARKYTALGIYLFVYCNQSHRGVTRNFAPVVGIIEDSATGTSAAALACFLHQQGRLESNPIKNLCFKQGPNLPAPGELHVELRCEKKETRSVKVGGFAKNHGSSTISLKEL
ncbi:MAG: PhzF family phenazine biosynthesis protein [Myxococcota bacterium]|nr:PhzF family phenazine biosynthesis protein [Myxococcota bacterium]